MKKESYEYLKLFEDRMDTAFRSGYCRFISDRDYKKLLGIYEELAGGKSGYANCMSGNKCQTNLLLELRVEYIKEKELMEGTTAKIEELIRQPKNNQKKQGNGKEESRSAEEI